MRLEQPIAKGNTADIYLSGNEVVKVFNKLVPEDEILKEANKQKRAYSCGLPVPKVLNVGKINDKQAIKMEYIEGDSLGNLFLNDQTNVEYYLNISIDMQLKVHNCIVDDIEPMYNKLYRQIESVNLLDKRQKFCLLKRLESFTFDHRLCHGDFHLFNLIQTNNEVVVIDWMDASIGDIRADVYRTYLLYLQSSPELADIYLRIYCGKSGISKTEIFQWAPIIAGARLSEDISSENPDQLIKIVNKYCFP